GGTRPWDAGHRPARYATRTGPRLTRATRNAAPGGRRTWHHGGGTPAPPMLCLVIGDEELLVERAVADVSGVARAGDPEADVRQLAAAALAAGELDEVLSPSLFGGRRVLVVRDGQDAKKELSAALLRYAQEPDPDVCLVVTHAGGAKDKA